MKTDRLLLLAAVVLSVVIFSPGAGAAGLTDGTEAADSLEKEDAYADLLSGKTETVSGLFTLHKKDGQLYFEVPLSLMGRDMLLGSTVSGTSDNTNSIVGSKPFDPVFFNFSVNGKKVCMNLLKEDYIVPAGYEKAFAASSLDPVFRSFAIKAYNRDSSAVVFDVTDLFLGTEEILSPFDPYSANLSGGLKRSETFHKDRSYIEGIKAFGDNVVIKSMMSYTYSLSGEKTVVEDEPFTALMTRSIVLLREKPVRPRITDSRIAIFPTAKIFFGPGAQRSETVYFANRWNLEPSDIAAYIRGETVDPVRPIVFYIDDAFPEKWRPYIKEGVEQWSEVFEEIGFRNAVVAEDFPDDDPEFDPDNIKYSCVRYAPIGIQNAMGPSWVDPRSGEIINASVYVYHDVIRLLNQWLMIQTSPADARVRKMHIPDEIIGDGLRYVVSHEIGHCLGFMHNMGASSTFPVDSLRSPSFTRKYGTTPSIMDYARFNYVAQPGDAERGVKLTPPRFGEYDRFLVKWSYTPLPDALDIWDEYAVTSGWISEKSSDPIYRYGRQQMEIIDPRSQSEDLGDDAVRASGYGISNLKYVLEHLNEWVAADDTDFSYRKSIYDGVIMQYYLYLSHVFANVGGIWLYEKHVGDDVPMYRSVPSARQRESVMFLLSQLDDLSWIDNRTLMADMPLEGAPSDVLRNLIIKMLLASPEKLELSASKAEDDPYTVEECLEDVYGYIWKPLMDRTALTPEQMLAQELFLRNIGTKAGVSIPSDGKAASLVSSTVYDLVGEDSLACPQERMGYGEPLIVYNVPRQYEGLYFGYVDRIRKLLWKNRNSADSGTRMHCRRLLHLIDKAME